MWRTSLGFEGIEIFLEPYLFQKMKGLIWRWKEEVEVEVEVVVISSSEVVGAVENGRRWM